MPKSNKKSGRRKQDKFKGLGTIAALVFLFLFGFALLWRAEPEADTRTYEIECLTDAGVYYKFVKGPGEWWRTAHGTLIVKDRGTEREFNRRRCTWEPIDE